MPKALHHVAPSWTRYPEIYLRVVTARRARKLRKRGVPLGQLARGKYFWIESPTATDNRKHRRGGRCYEMHRKAAEGRAGRKYWLATRLAEQRTSHQMDLARRRLQRLGIRLHRKLRMAEAEIRAYIAQGYAIRVGFLGRAETHESALDVTAHPQSNPKL